MDTHTDIQQLSPQDRYLCFIKKITDTGNLWTLIDDDGNFTLFEVNNTIVFSLWPDEASIGSNLTPDWQDHIPFKLDMETLEETVIPLIRQNCYSINVFPVDAKTGYIVALNDFVQDLNAALG
jgi:hypothetical protein